MRISWSMSPQSHKKTATTKQPLRRKRRGLVALELVELRTAVELLEPPEVPLELRTAVELRTVRAAVKLVELLVELMRTPPVVCVVAT